jgi:hypothetical protein
VVCLGELVGKNLSWKKDGTYRPQFSPLNERDSDVRDDTRLAGDRSWGLSFT